MGFRAESAGTVDSEEGTGYEFKNAPTRTVLGFVIEGGNVTAFADLRRKVSSLDQLTREAYVEEVLVVPLDDAAARKWERLAAAEDEPWVFIAGGGRTWALDRPSGRGERDPTAAVIFPPLHTQLVGWWLFHAWRSVDLLEAALDASARGTTSVAAVTVRALMEELGCLVTEVGQIRRRWEAVKLQDVNSVRRVELVQQELGRLLTKLEFASRLAGRPERLPNAVNVQTYIDKLDKMSRSSKFSNWYDWLSDASHPAFAARLVYVTNPSRHAAGATILRFHSRSPLHLVDSRGDRTEFTYDIELKTSAALDGCGALLMEFLSAALEIVDDFGLTTKAPTMTERSYWRNFSPVSPGSECLCGCGLWAESLHSWRQPVRTLPAMAT